MKYIPGLVFALVCCGCLQAENWPVWRGPRLDGTSSEMKVPLHWSASSNIAWKVELPGEGHASPIVWEDKIFTVVADKSSQERILACFDRKDGKLLWKKVVIKAPLERVHSLNSHASSTPATDGELVYTAFLDVKEMVVTAHDFAGKQVWQVRPGVFSSMHGFCSSPILYKDMVIVNGDHDGDSYLLALRQADGKTVWKTPRQNKTRSYCVPIIRDLADKTQMVLSGDKSVASYDPNNGKMHWILDGPTEQFVASIVLNEKTGLLYVTGGYPEHHILALKPDGQGNISKAGKIVWRTTKGAAYVPSPICHGDFFLIVSDSGIGHCFDAATGKIHWQERMGIQHASLVSANGLVYFLNDDGIMHVVSPGTDYKLVAKNELGEKTFASPAISQGQMIIKGAKHLYCIGKL